MYAAPTVEFINFSRSGVDLIPGSPAPQWSAVNAYFGPVVSVIEPILPYSVAIKNNNDTAVAELVVRWTLTSSAGIKITDTGHFKFVGTHLRTGEMILMAPLSGLSIPMRGRCPNLINTAGLANRMTALVQKYQSQSQISIALDAIVFGDNSLIGPDLAGNLNVINSERTVKRLVATELLKRAPADRGVCMKSLLAAPEAVDLYEVAQMFKRIKDTFDSASLGEDSFRASLEDAISRAQEIHRRVT